MSEQKWLAAYLYYGEPFEPILKEFVKPLVDDIIAYPKISQYFYIRYWHKGPHIRLRFKGDRRFLDEVIKNRLETRFEAFVEAHPSTREEPEWTSRLNDEDQWIPNNTLKYVPYEPEIKRYGGKTATKIAEQHFQHSSETILNIISESNNKWDYEQTMGTAIQLHLCFADALGMDIEEAQQFFKYIYVLWFPMTFKRNRPKLNNEELAEIRVETLDAFKKGFEQQKEVLLPFCEQFWEAIHDRQTPEGLKPWLQNTKNIRKKLLDCQQNGLLDAPPEFMPEGKWEVSNDKQERWLIYQSYVHMTNNRLGILNRDEGFLGYLLKECFSYLGKAQL